MHGLEGRHVVRRPDRRTGGSGSDALQKPGQYFTGADFVESRDTGRRHRLHAFAPAHGARRHLLDQRCGFPPVDRRSVAPAHWRPPARPASSRWSWPAPRPWRRQPVASARNGTGRKPETASRAWRPLLLAISSARSTAALLPETHHWPPPLSLAAWQTWPCAASAATAAASSKDSPSKAAIAPSPTGTAFCMALPRMRNRRAASPMVKAPAAASAEYSPSEWPATHLASRRDRPRPRSRARAWRRARPPSARAARSR